MLRYKLRTLLIVLALGPPLLAGAWYGWQKLQKQRSTADIEELLEILTATIVPNTSTTLEESDGLSDTALPDNDPFAPGR